VDQASPPPGCHPHDDLPPTDHPNARAAQAGGTPHPKQVRAARGSTPRAGATDRKERRRSRSLTGKLIALARPGHDRRRLEATQAQALSHPVRKRILSLFKRNTGRSLAADDLLTDLVEEDGDAFGHFDAGQIFYHRALLQDAELLPA
jgi:hypothetical protein